MLMWNGQNHIWAKDYISLILLDNWFDNLNIIRLIVISNHSMSSSRDQSGILFNSRHFININCWLWACNCKIVWIFQNSDCINLSLAPNREMTVRCYIILNIFCEPHFDLIINFASSYKKLRILRYSQSIYCIFMFEKCCN